MSQPPLFAAIDEHAVPIEPLLRAILARVEADARFRADLDACNFQPWPSTADEIDCRNPWMFVIAMNGGGSAYGLYLHPNAMQAGTAPWVYWEHEDDTIRYLASDTDRFFRGLIADTEGWSEEPAKVTRARAVLEEIGVAMDGEPIALDFDAAPGAPWLPPIGDDVKKTAHYLGLLEADPDEAERGLLARAMGFGEEDADDALRELWERQGRRPPRSSDD